MQMAWSSSLNRQRKYKRSWFFKSLTWKEKDIGSAWAKLKPWYLVRDSICLSEKSGKYPRAECFSEFNTKSIFCKLCSIRIHKRCGGISGTLMPDPTLCWLEGPLDGRPIEVTFTVAMEKSKVVPYFLHLHAYPKVPFAKSLPSHH